MERAISHGEKDLLRTSNKSVEQNGVYTHVMFGIININSSRSTLHCRCLLKQSFAIRGKSASFFIMVILCNCPANGYCQE